MSEFNTELFAKVRDAINAESAGVGFDMSTWEGLSASAVPEAACATTRCVAGWAISLTLDAPLHSGRDQYGYKVISTPVVDLMRELELDADDFAGAAAELLGLNDEEGELFYASEDVARRFVEAAADGNDDVAREILADYLSYDEGDDE